MVVVFQYGSNTNSERINSENRLRGDAQFIGLAFTVDEYRLDFTTWSVDNQCAAADIISEPGRKIWGVLYKIPDHLIEKETSGDRKSLDAIEGGNYQRESIKLKYPDGTPVAENVITYMVKDKKSGIRTSFKYAEYIITGLREHYAPDEYIEYVKMRVIANNPELRHRIEAL